MIYFIIEKNHSAFFVVAGEKLGGDCIDNMARDYGSLNQGSSGKSGEKQSDSGDTVKREPTGFSYGFPMVHVGEQGGIMNDSCLSSLKDGLAIY